MQNYDFCAEYRTHFPYKNFKILLWNCHKIGHPGGAKFCERMSSKMPLKKLNFGTMRDTIMSYKKLIFYDSILLQNALWDSPSQGVNDSYGTNFYMGKFLEVVPRPDRNINRRGMRAE